jgi:hypothetical protein
VLAASVGLIAVGTGTIFSLAVFPGRWVGTTFGGSSSFPASAWGPGAYGGGFLYDYLGTYWTLHLASTSSGRPAVAMALTLRATGPGACPRPGHLTDSDALLRRRARGRDALDPANCPPRQAYPLTGSGLRGRVCPPRVGRSDTSNPQ